MKKLLTMLLSLALVFSVFSVGTAAQETDITGVWYGSVYGLMMTLTLDEAGEYTMEMAGEEPDTGKWQIDGDALKLDAGTEAELIFTYDGESIYADLGEGMEFNFNREPAAHFEPAAARTDAKLEELIGEWVCTLVSVFGMQMPPEIADMDLQLNIDGEAVTMSVSVMGEFTTAELQAVFADGTLTMVQTAQNITENETVWIIQLLEDGTLSASSMMFEDPIVFYLEPAAE